MKRYITLTLLVLLTIQAQATITLDREENMFGIPGLSEISSEWLFEITDSTDLGIMHPVDIEVLKLSPADYRVVVLEDSWTLFTCFRIKHDAPLEREDVARSCLIPENLNYPRALCKIQNQTYFSPQDDRVAVVFRGGATIGIYKFDGITGKFRYESAITNPLITRPIGIHYENGSLFIVDENAKSIFRTDLNGSILASYGHPGVFDDGYQWLSDISGFVDSNNRINLYVSDGGSERVDHLIAGNSNPAISLESQALALSNDFDGMNVHESAIIQGLGVIGFNRFQQKLYLWDRFDTFSQATRNEVELVEPVVHIREVCGRLILVRFALDPSYGWKIESYSVNGHSFDNPMVYPSDHWTISHSPIYITSNYAVRPGEQLVIDAGVEVLLDQDVTFIVDQGATLIVNGTPSKMVTFDAMDEGEKWYCMEVNGEVSIEGARFINASAKAAIYTDKPIPTSLSHPVSIVYCQFDGRGLLLTGSPKETQYVSECLIENIEGLPGLQTSNCYVKINNTTVRNCSYANTYISKTSGSFDKCLFEGEASKYGVMLNTETCNPYFTCCRFQDLASETSTYRTTVYSATGCNPVFGQENSENYANEFRDDSDYLLVFQGKGPLPVLLKRPNDFIQNNSHEIKYMSWVDYPPFVSQFIAIIQYWNVTPEINYFRPSDASYWDFSSPSPTPYGVCGSGTSSIQPGPTAGRSGHTLDEDSLIVDTLLYAIDLENEEMFAEAQALYLYVIEHAQDPSTIWSAASRLVTTDVHLIEGEEWIPSYINALIAQHGASYDAVLHGKRILVNYYVNKNAFESALNLCAELLEDSLAFEDSIFVATDLNLVQMAAGSIDWDDGSLDESFANRIPQSMRIESLEEGLTREQYLIGLLGTIEGSRPSNWDNAIPDRFALYQNYPNPFNPTTQIRYDIPENTHVRINVYNTLGQRVATLLDNIHVAGTYTVTWNSKNSAGHDVASGLYIFRMEAGNFVDAKKMVLMR
ncbi:T9SS type A sorting domain-containing protein [bacterium]|nr:T9SS type A sorting domain-containing protein [bacterium]MBU1638444.1 T9SS type A sorting domain-containing protein [bacterium]